MVFLGGRSGGEHGLAIAGPPGDRLEFADDVFQMLPPEVHVMIHQPGGDVDREGNRVSLEDRQGVDQAVGVAVVERDADERLGAPSVDDPFSSLVEAHQIEPAPGDRGQCDVEELRGDLQDPVGRERRVELGRSDVMQRQDRADAPTPGPEQPGRSAGIQDVEQQSQHARLWQSIALTPELPDRRRDARPRLLPPPAAHGASVSADGVTRSGPNRRAR